MASSSLLISSLLLLCFLGTSYAKAHFSSLERTLVVTASPKEGEVLQVGENITVKWSFNQSFPSSTEEAYKKVKVKLCFAPISQKDRAWRKTEDELQRDKTCQFTIVDRPYDSSTNRSQSIEWPLERDIPTGTYFIRVYAFNSEGHELAYGQTTDDKKTTNFFDVQSITGRHTSIDIAAGCFSGFSVLSLFYFFYMEKRKARNFQRSSER